MKNTIVFLHGKGKRPDDLQYKVFEQIAERFDADIVPIVAPFPHKEGTRWHNGNKLSVEESYPEFLESMAHVEAGLKKIVDERRISYNDITYLAHSQGSDMSIRMAMIHGAKKVIVFGAGLYGFELPKNARTDFPIVWVEAGKEDVVAKDRRQTYIKLQQMGFEVKHILSPNSTHNVWDIDNVLLGEI